MRSVLLLCLVLIAGCQGYTDAEWRNQQSNRFKYVKDHRTGICFAERGHGLTAVPCSPEVIALLRNP